MLHLFSHVMEQQLLQGLVFGIVGALAIPVDRIELFRLRSNREMQIERLLQQTLPRCVQVPSRFVLEFDWRSLRLDEDTWSGSKVNRLIGEFLGEALPSVHFAHH